MSLAVAALVGLAASGALAADKTFGPIADTAGKFAGGTSPVFAIASVPVSASPGGAVFATLSATTEAKVLGAQGDQLKMQVSGWRQEGGARRVFFARGSQQAADRHPRESADP